MGILSYGYKALKTIGSPIKHGTKVIKSVKPKSNVITKGKVRLLKKLGKTQKKIGIDKFKKTGGDKLTNEALKLREPKMGGGMMGRQMYKKGGKSFPDLTGDGKVTKKDILRGRGVPGFSIGGGVGKLKNKLKTTKGKPKIIRTDIKKEFGIKNLDKDKNNAKN